MKKIIYLIVIFVLAYILYSCLNKRQEYKTFNVMYCNESQLGLHYNYDKLIEYGEKFYTRKMIGYYVNGKLNNVDIYKSDGIISYTNYDIKSDKTLAKYLSIPINRKIIIIEDTLSDNGILFTYERKDDSIFVYNKNELIIYVKDK